MMSKKLFIAIAAALRTKLNAHAASPIACEGIEQTALRFCATFKAENPRFDHSRFLAAPGVDPSC